MNALSNSMLKQILLEKSRAQQAASVAPPNGKEIPAFTLLLNLAPHLKDMSVLVTFLRESKTQKHADKMDVIECQAGEDYKSGVHIELDLNELKLIINPPWQLGSHTKTADCILKGDGKLLLLEWL